MSSEQLETLRKLYLAWDKALDEKTGEGWAAHDALEALLEYVGELVESRWALDVGSDTVRAGDLKKD